MTKRSGPVDHPRPNVKERNRRRILSKDGNYEMRSGRVYDLRTGLPVDPKTLKRAMRERLERRLDEEQRRGQEGPKTGPDAPEKDFQGPSA